MLWLPPRAEAATILDGGDLTQDKVLTAAGSPYVCNNPLGVNASVTLRLEPGAVLEMGPKQALRVRGTLIAQDATFRKLSEPADSAHWGGVVFEAPQRDSTLTGCRIQDCGGKYRNDTVSAGVELDSPNPVTLASCTVTGSDAFGVSVRQGVPSLTGCEVSGCAKDALVAVAGSPTLTNCTFSNSQYGINCLGNHTAYANPPVDRPITGCTLKGNQMGGFLGTVVQASRLDPATRLEGNTPTP